MAAMLVAGYALFGTVSKAPALPETATEVAANGPAEIAAAAPAEQSDATDRNEAQDKPETPAVPNGVILTSAEELAGAAPAAASPAEPAAKPAIDDARTYRERGMFAYRDGDLYSALADFDMAIERDPRFAGAYVNRGIIWYRMREFNRAFADLAQAKRIKNASRAKISTTASHKGSPARTHDAPKNFDKRSLMEARGAATGP
jgi:tetratricopeptide (TPR) repeat protein